MTAVRQTSIEGLLKVELDVHGDSRGWFKESYQAAKLAEQGLPEMHVVQNNVSYNAQAGVTRGIHAEPWDKYVSPAHGRVFCALVDLRKGPGFGTVVTTELGVGDGLYLPAGVGNSFCTLEPHTVYNYLVNAHWSPESAYTMVNLFDPTLAVPWPVDKEDMVLSDKDLTHPLLADVTPVPR